MARPFSDDLRERMVRAVEAGRSRHEVGRIFGVSASYRQSGDFWPHKFGGDKKPV
jgi:hypothetical protein